MILNLDWDTGPNALSLDAASNVVTWLIERFTFDGAQDIPAAVLAVRGIDQSARIIDAGYTLHACLTNQDVKLVNPNDIMAFDILGPRPLNQLIADFSKDAHIVARTDPMSKPMDIKTANNIVALLDTLPWFRQLFNLTPSEFHPQHTANCALLLGMPETLLNADDDI